MIACRSFLLPAAGARALTLALLLGAGANAAAELPVPCSPCVGNIPWTNPAGLTAAQRAPRISNGGRDMLILQGRNRQVYSWETFNIGAGKSIEFRQPSASSVALNRVLDPAERLSVIEGALKANGQVYLINRNGILFRGGASVDVNTLLASTLDVNQAVDGLFEQIGIGNVLAERITLEQTAALVDDLAGLPGEVRVERGAVIEAGRNGRVILVGANVHNAGVLRLSGPGGQALLVAGEDRVYFFGDDDTRGLGVEIGSGGTVSNVGQIIAGNGNVSLAGLTVNQNGVVRATTAVSANGTIRLQARDGAFGAGVPDIENEIDLRREIDFERLATRSGTVSLGAGSVTEIVPETGAPEVVVDEQAFQRASVEIRAQDIVMRRDARITAPAGDVELLATERPALGNASVNVAAGTPGLDAGSITLERGATIDVAGLSTIELPAARNVLSLQLRRAELSASPLNRDGPLLGETIVFDLRDAPSWIDVSGALDSIGRTIGERSTIGGNIRLYAVDEIDIGAGALLDVSGGAITYLASRAGVSRVISDNRILALSEVAANTRIDAVVAPNESIHPRWGYASVFGAAGEVGTLLPGYVEGKDAGAIEIASLNIVKGFSDLTLAQQQLRTELNGTLRGRRETGRFQIEAPQPGAAGGFARAFDEVPLGGSLTLTSRAGDYRLGPSSLDEADGASAIYDGLTRFDLEIGSFRIAGGDDIDLGGGGALSVTARAGGITVGGQVSAPGGSIDLTASGNLLPPLDPATALAEKALVIAPGAVLDVAGVWFSDNDAAADGAAFIDGGSVDLTGIGDGALVVAAGSRVSVGGGARALEGGDLLAGEGGALFVSDGITAAGTPNNLTLGGELDGHVFKGAEKGSSLVLNAQGVALVPGARLRVVDNEFRLGPAFFLDGGFTDFRVVSTRSPTRIESGFDLDLIPDYRIPAGVARQGPAELATEGNAAGGTALEDVSAIGRVDNPAERAPTSLALFATQADSEVASNNAAFEPLPPGIEVQRGARVATDVGGEIRLGSSGAIAHAGALTAPGGQVVMDVFGSINFRDDLGISGFDRADFEPGFSAARAVWLLSDSLIDVSGVVLDVARDPRNGLVSRSAVPGGKVLLRTGISTDGTPASSGGGFVIAAPGARIDVSGAVGETGALIDNGGIVPEVGSVPVVSDAGGVTVEAGYGFQFFAELAGDAASVEGARAGSLSLLLDLSRTQINDDLSGARVLFPDRDAIRVELERGAAYPDIEPLANVADDHFGFGRFSLSAYEEGGFDTLALGVRAQERRTAPVDPGLSILEPRIDLVGDLHFDAGRRLDLNSPVLGSDGGRVTIEADYLRLGYDDDGSSRVPAAVNGDTGFSGVAGSGSAIFDATLIDFAGLLGLRGFGGPNADRTASSGLVAFLSDTDIRFDHVLLPRTSSSLRSPLGRIDAAGDLLFKAQRVYATTLTDFTISNSVAGGAVVFAGGNDGIALVDRAFAPLPGAVHGRLRGRLGGIPQDTVPLSAGGAVTVNADRIVQSGNLFAPFGAVTLDADRLLVLEPGSLTSVTGFDRSVLYGKTSLGEWEFAFPDQNFTLIVEPGSDEPFALPLPEKQIRLVADGLDGGLAAGVIKINEGATLDVRAGGSLVATEFVQGPIGKVDILGAGAVDGSFALLPVDGMGVAPLDPIESRASAFAENAQFEVIDGGSSGLEPGRYAVLPPRFALLPGGVLLTPETDAATDILGGAGAGVTNDGIALAAGVRTRLGDNGVNALAVRQYRVESAAELAERAEYKVTTASEFFPQLAATRDRAVPLLPGDAGAVQILPNLSLRLGGAIAEGGVAGGLGNRVDISAGDLLLADDPAAFNPAGGVVLLTDELAALRADSLLIGGTRTIERGVEILDVSADTVTVDGAVDLTVSAVTLAANDAVRLRDGARMTAAPLGTPAAQRSLQLAGDAAVVRASSAALPAFTRQDVPIAVTVSFGADQFTTSDAHGFADGQRVQIGGETVPEGLSETTSYYVIATGANTFQLAATPNDALLANPIDIASGGSEVAVIPPAGVTRPADVIVENGAQLASSRTLLIDGTGAVTLDGRLNLGDGGEFRLGAPAIGLGDVPGAFVGAVINAAFASDVELGVLEFSSPAPISLFGDTGFAADRVVFDAAGLRGMGGAGDTFAVDAQTFTLRNSSGAVVEDFAGAGAGALQLRGGSASVLALDTTRGDALGLAGDTSDFDVFGFAAGVLLTAERVTGNGEHQFDTPDSLDLNARIIAPAAGAAVSLSAAGPLATRSTGTLTESDPFATLGARVTLRGQRVNSGVDVLARSGRIELHATGTGSNDRVVVGGRLDASGLDNEAFGLTRASSPGGSVLLTSAGSGNTAGNAAVTLGASALIDVSGGGGNQPQPGGRLSIEVAAGALQVADGAIINGTSTGDAAGAGFWLDAGKVSSGVDALFGTLDNGFGGVRELRLRTGDLIIDGGRTIVSSRQRYTADAGTVTIGNATLDASGWWAGSITVNGGNGVVLGDGARLLARARGWFATSDGAGVEDGLPGGIVTLSAPAGALTLADGARIDVSGTVPAGSNVQPVDTGRVRLLAARDGNDIDIVAPLAAAITGAGSGAVELVANRRYTSATVGGADADAVALTANENAVLTRLGIAGDDRFRVAPGVELGYAGGDLSGSNLLAELDALFDAGSVNAGVLSVRADGDLTIDADVVDGLLEVATPESVTPPFGAGFVQTRYLLADEQASWTLQLVAGADATSADLLALGDANNTLMVEAGVEIVTGSGDINLAASGDIELHYDAVSGENANVFVAGRHDSLTTYLGSIDNTIALPDSGPGFIKPNPTAAEEVLSGVSLPDSGGDVSFRAGGNLRGGGHGQFVSEWITRTGLPSGAIAHDLLADGIDAREVMPSAWGVFIDRTVAQNVVVNDNNDRGFNQGIAAFGGGNILVDVKGSVSDVSFSIPTVGRQVGNNTFGDVNRPEPAIQAAGLKRWLDVADDADDFVNVVDEIGGGQLSLRAGGDISDVDLVVFRGAASLHSGGAIRLGRVAAGNAGIAAHATIGMTVEGVVDPALLSLDLDGIANATRTFVTDGNEVARSTLAPGALETGFFSIGADAYFDLSTAAGDFVLNNDSSLFETNGDLALAGVFAGDGRLAALSGNLQARQTAIFFPDSSGTLTVLAGDSIRNAPGQLTPAVFMQSDFERALLPSRDEPANNPDLTLFISSLGPQGTFGPAAHARQPVHLGDRKPNNIVARRGDVSDVRLVLSKLSRVAAGEDIDRLDLVVQHVNGGDLSIVEAGRDIRFPAQRSQVTGRITPAAATAGTPSTNEAKIAVGGPGAMQILAGRNINLGALDGIKSFGDESNPVLADVGADLLIFAGLSSEPDYAAFITRFLDPDSDFVVDGELSADAIGTAVLERIRRVYGDQSVQLADLDIDDGTRLDIQAALANYLTELDVAGAVTLDPALANVEQFKTQLSDAEQRAFVIDLFFDELQASSLEAANPGSGRLNNFIRGRHAIATLFPADNYSGDVVSALSAVQTLDGGDIQLLAPGGTVDAGTTAQTSVSKQPLDLGYVAFRDGGVSMFTGQSINVNSTRIFTQKGGDITLWADRGNIDAGRGQRDAITLASTTPVFDEFLNFVDEPPISVSGSGIRTLAPAGVDGGSIFLAAPEGVIDAGDAGIESDSGLVLAAQEVANADFISAGGPTFSTVQVPTSVGASLGNLGDVSAAATASVTESTQAAAAAAAEQAAAAADGAGAPVARVTVNVLSFGN